MSTVNMEPSTSISMKSSNPTEDNQPKLTTIITEVQPETTTSTTVNIDYRTLVKRSRYTQIEAELDKLKLRLDSIEDEQNRNKRIDTKSVASETIHERNVISKEHVTFENGENSERNISKGKLSQTLVNIEDDLHRILFVLLRQYEIFNQRFSKNSTIKMLPKPESKTISQTTPKEQFSKELSAKSRAESQPNLATRTNIENSLNKNNKNSQPKQDIHNDSIIGISKPLHDFRSKSIDRLNRKSTSIHKPHEPHQIYHCHYHVTKPDVHWILGTSPNPSYSMMARKQMKLAQLKQHGSLCFKLPEIDTLDSSGDRSRIIHRIQSMINQLQKEYDRLYRQLQFQQTFSSSIDIEDGHEETEEITNLSQHLVHIMNHLYDLHQLNKSILF